MLEACFTSLHVPPKCGASPTYRDRANKSPKDIKREGKEKRLDRSVLSHEGVFSYAFVCPFLPENLTCINSSKFQLIKM